MIAILPVAAEKKAGSSRQFTLLASIDRFKRRRKTAAFAKSHFDENQAWPVQHDQIDFAETATKISCDQFQPAGLQMFERKLFRRITGH